MRKAAASDMGLDGAELSCPGSSVVADKKGVRTNEGQIGYVVVVSLL
jgi:hypothetical protein